MAEHSELIKALRGCASGYCADCACDGKDDFTDFSCINSLMEQAADALENVVEVVRCKDCAWCQKVDEFELWCGNLHPMVLVAPDDFCSHGRRKHETKTL